MVVVYNLRIWIGSLWLLIQLTSWAIDRPNVILIMVDDLGHECVESYGGTSYATPHLTRMALTGAQFNNAHAQNICTPSRVQIMTGQYNVRNYTRFATLDQSQKTAVCLDHTPPDTRLMHHSSKALGSHIALSEHLEYAKGNVRQSPITESFWHLHPTAIYQQY